MAFISYAQNFEDVILHRALKDVDKGFYIDVGANDPVKDSVTKVFYDMGWHGINIEPVYEWYNKYKVERPEDINLQLAIGDCEGKANFYEVVGTGLSTTDESIAKRHAQDHGFAIKSYKVPITKLTAICEKYAEADIHFLKVDVEGAELSVLKGFNLKKFRPWIIVVESTLPGTKKEKFKVWDAILLAADYEYIMFDGLNRFYIAKEHVKLKKNLMVPPNVFDGFVLSGTGSSSFHVGVANTRLALQEEIKDREREIKEQEHSLKVAMIDAQQQCQEIEKHAHALTVQVNQKDEKLREHESKQQELLLSLVEKETKQQETAIGLRDSRQEIKKLEGSLVKSKEQEQSLKVAMIDAQQQCQEIEKHAHALTAQVNQKDERLREHGDSISWLNNELELAKHKVDELHQSNHRWWSMTEEQSRGLEEAKTKIDGLNHSSHHWWLESERLNEELQAFYSSNSWRLTWPLRQLVRFIKWLFYIPIHIVIWLIRAPKRVLRWILVKLIAFVLNRPALRAGIRQWLVQYPRIYNKLLLLACARELKSKKSYVSQKGLVKEVGIKTTPQQDQLVDNLVQTEQLNNIPYREVAEQKNIQVKLMESANIWKLGERIDT